MGDFFFFLYCSFSNAMAELIGEFKKKDEYVCYIH